jgi:hypothetical protein
MTSVNNQFLPYRSYEPTTGTYTTTYLPDGYFKLHNRAQYATLSKNYSLQNNQFDSTYGDNNLRYRSNYQRLYEPHWLFDLISPKWLLLALLGIFGGSFALIKLWKRWSNKRTTISKQIKKSKQDSEIEAVLRQVDARKKVKRAEPVKDDSIQKNLARLDTMTREELNAAFLETAEVEFETEENASEYKPLVYSEVFAEMSQETRNTMKKH